MKPNKELVEEVMDNPETTIREAILEAIEKTREIENRVKSNQIEWLKDWICNGNHRDPKCCDGVVSTSWVISKIDEAFEKDR